MAFEPVKAGWLKLSPRTDAEAGATEGSGAAFVDGSTVAGADEGAGGTEVPGADDGGTDDGGTDDDTTVGGTVDGGVIGYCVCAPA